MTPRELIDWTLQNPAGARLPSSRRNAGSTASPISTRRTTSTASPGRTAIPLQARLAECAVPRRSAIGPVADAGAARPLGRDRGGGRRASVPARDLAGARLPQLVVHRDADLARQGGRPEVMIHPEDAASARVSPTATRSRSATGAARSPARPAFRRRAPRRADRGIDLAERGLRGRPRHQHAHRRRRGRALRRRRVPRQQGMDQAGRGLIGSVSSSVRMFFSENRFPPRIKSGAGSFRNMRLPHSSQPSLRSSE